MGECRMMRGTVSKEAFCRQGAHEPLGAVHTRLRPWAVSGKSGVTIEARNLQHDGPPTPNQREKRPTILQAKKGSASLLWKSKLKLCNPWKSRTIQSPLRSAKQARVKTTAIIRSRSYGPYYGPPHPEALLTHDDSSNSTMNHRQNICHTSDISRGHTRLPQAHI